MSELRKAHLNYLDEVASQCFFSPESPPDEAAALPMTRILDLLKSALKFSRLGWTYVHLRGVSSEISTSENDPEMMRQLLQGGQVGCVLVCMCVCVVSAVQEKLNEAASTPYF